MKKALSLLLAFVMCLSLCACGGGNDKENNDTSTNDSTREKSISKDEMMQCAVEIDDYKSAMQENKARAEATYIGNVYYITGKVSNIESDHIDVGDFTVYLPREDIMQVSKGQQIKVVGKIDSLSYETVSDGWGGYYDECTGVMSSAYFVTDRFDVNGTLIMYYISLRDINGKTDNRYGVESAWEIGLDVVPDATREVYYHMEDEIPVNHVLGQKITTVEFGGQELKDGSQITVSAKLFWDANLKGYVLKEAELVSVN